LRGSCSNVVAVLRRVPLTLRALLLVPVIAVLADLARVTFACAPGAESCFQAAAQGWLGPLGSVVLAVYAVALAFVVGRLAAGGRGSLSRLWLIGAAGLAAVCLGQALLVGAIADAAALGGGWLELLALCSAAGGIVALALRVAPAAAALVRSLRPRAPRPRLEPVVALAAPALPVRRIGPPLSPATAGRAPPLTLG
jgi:hypothetical protein